MTRCPTCGTSYGDEARFCTKDGTRLVAAVAPRTAAAPPSAGRAPAGTPPSAVKDATNVAATNATAPVTEMIGHVLQGRYKILKKLGEGGMSYVYLAEDAANGNTTYAIKVLSPALSNDENAMARLRREADLGGRLEHANICHIIGVGETPEHLVYIVMPYIEGEILADRTHRAGQLPPDEVVRWVNDISAGLERAHELQIVHRDLKPENIMLVAEDGGRDRAVVMDFGLAKERRAEGQLAKLTATGIILGTPEFMSPEQIRGKQLDARSDIYALGIVAFEMFTGKLPFQGRNAQEMMIARLRGQPQKLRQLRPDASEGLEKVLARAMDSNPDARYNTTLEFAEALTPSGEGGFLSKIKEKLK